VIDVVTGRDFTAERLDRKNRELEQLRLTLAEANAAASRAGIREGETLADLILRLYSETLSDD